jgi:hypothetical protein
VPNLNPALQSCQYLSAASKTPKVRSRVQSPGCASHPIIAHNSSPALTLISAIKAPLWISAGNEVHTASAPATKRKTAPLEIE